MAQENTNSCIFVGNLPDSVTKLKMIHLFKDFGDISFAEVVIPSHPAPKFGFVTFQETDSAKRAITAGRNGIQMESKTLRVEKKSDENSKISLPNSEGAIDNKHSMKILNQDCLLRIFSYLTLKDRIQCESVCRGWRAASLESWTSVKEIRMVRLFLVDWLRFPLLEDMIGIMRKTTGALTSLDLSDCYFSENIDTELSKVLSLVTDKLTCLHINNCLLAVPNRHFTMPKPISIPIPLVAHTLRECAPHLKELSIHDTVYNKKIKCSNSALDDFWENKMFDRNGEPLSRNLLKSYFKLKSFKERVVAVHFNDFVEEMENFPLENFALAIHEADYQLKIPCNNLKQLTLNLYYFPGCFVENSVDFSSIPKLEELTVIQAAKFLLNDTNMKSLVKHCPFLKKLSVEWILYRCQFSNVLISASNGFVIEDFLNTVMKLEHLEHLDISYFNMAFKDHLKSLTKFKKLQSLIMHGMTNKIDVSFKDLTYLIDSLPSLTLLDISGSVNLSKENLNLPEFYNKFSSEPSVGKPNIEIVLGGCSLDLSGVKKCGRYIINGSDNSREVGYYTSYINVNGDADDFHDAIAFRDYDSEDDGDDDPLPGDVEDLEGDLPGVL